MDLSIVRTMLFTPANRPERFAKAKQAGADGLVIDLEDAIPLADKAAAREIAFDYLKTHPLNSDFLVTLRINSIKTAAGLNDLLALINSEIHIDALVLPKVEHAQEIILYQTHLAQMNVPFIALIETARGLYNAVEIANSSKNVRALVFGGGDLAADLGAALEWEPMLMARSLVVQAAASAGIVAIDVPYLKLNGLDDAELINETKKVKALGYTGKFAIHPSHLQTIIDTFTPSADEIKQAKRVVALYEKSGGEACEIDGKMIDVPIYRSAKRIVELAAKI